MIRTVRIQKLTKNSFGKSLPIISINMLHVMNQLFTTMMWNSVTMDDPKSLKFIR